MYRTMFIASLLVLLSLATFAADPVVSPADAFITVVCVKALPGDAALNVELATAKGAVTRAFAAGIALKADALKLEGEKLTGTAVFSLSLGDPAKDTAIAITIDAVLADSKVTGTFTGTVGETKVKGDLSGSVRGLLASFGGRDFYPSSARPVGFLGNGTGNFPGATPVANWQEGTPVKITIPSEGKKPPTYMGLGDDKKVNVIWKSNMPGWVNSEPIVVGDKVFTNAEPNQLVCVDANTGKILWTRATNPFAATGSPVKDPVQMQTLRAIYHVLSDFSRYCSTNQPPDNWPNLKKQCTIFGTTVIPRLLEELKKVDPAYDYSGAATQTATAYAAAAVAFIDAKPGPDARKLPFETKGFGILPSAVSKRMTTLGGFNKEQSGLFLIPWGSMVGWEISAPVSDGKYVYTNLGQGALACYDMEGNLRWSQWTPEKAGMRLYTVQSPLVVDGVVISMMRGEAELIAFDTETGKEAWRAPTKGDFDKFGSGGGGHYVGSHAVVALPDADGKPVNVIVTTMCNIIRAKDGKPLGALPFATSGIFGGPTIIASGDIVMKGACGDSFKAPYIAYRLAFDGPDKVVAKELWRLPKTTSYTADIATPKFFLIDGIAYEPATGKKLFEVAGMRQTTSRVLIGDLLFGIVSADSWGSVQNNRDKNGSVASIFKTFTINSQNTVKAEPVSVLGGVPKPRYVEYDTYAPELMADPNFNGVWGGPPRQNLYTDNAVFAAGNRIFIRTAADLYCIGDPSVPYDWNPASRP